MKFKASQLLVLVSLLQLFCPSQAASTSNGEEARWLVQNSKWATLSWLEEGNVKASVTSIAESDGRIFFYLQNPEDEVGMEASITLSEAQVEPLQFFGAKCGPDGDLDPEDPRCAKLTISGIMSPCKDDSKQIALDALFATHPQMANWPEDHGFSPFELKIHEENGLWMIANFGGGGYMDATDYHDSEPTHHPMKGFGGGGGRKLGEASCYNPENHECVCSPEKCGENLCTDSGGVWSDMCPGTCDCVASEGASDTTREGHDDGTGGNHHGGFGGTGGSHGSGGEAGEYNGPAAKLLPRPDFKDDTAGHARWIVAKSLWTTISTASSSSEGQPFGNIRSVADGPCIMSSTGLPYFYVPAPDPTAHDIEKNKLVSLTFTEGALAERVGENGNPCVGKDAEDPTCAKISLVGHAIAIDDDDKIELAKNAFAAQHPRAPWLASGGGHTGGSYYTLHLHEITFLHSYGGFTAITADDYLAWKPALTKLPGEITCSTGGDEYQPTSGYGHGDENGGHNHHDGRGHGDGYDRHDGTYHSGDSHYDGSGRGEETNSYSSSTTSPSKSSYSIYSFAFLVAAAFVGSFVGGLYAEKMKTYFTNRRRQYTAANVEDNSLELEVSKAEAC